MSSEMLLKYCKDHLNDGVTSKIYLFKMNKVEVKSVWIIWWLNKLLTVFDVEHTGKQDLMLAEHITQKHRKDCHGVLWPNQSTLGMKVA